MTKIKATLRFNRLPDADLLKHLNTVYERMNGNPVFPKPPVNMAAFRTPIDTFSALVTEAEDGGRKAISAKNKQRAVVIKVKPLPKVVCCDVRYAAVGADKMPGTWTTVTLTSAKKATIDNPTPCTAYAFQVRALGRLGHTDWSDSITFIAPNIRAQSKCRCRSLAGACLRALGRRGDGSHLWQNDRMRFAFVMFLIPAILFVPQARAQQLLPGEREAVVTAIPGVIDAGTKWQLIWADLKTADGIVGTPDGGVIFAQEQTDTIRKLDVNDKEFVFLTDTHGGGSVSMDAQGRVYAVQRTCTDSARPFYQSCPELTMVSILAPERRLLANSFSDGKPLGRLNDLVADGRGGAYFTVGGAYHVSANGAVTSVADANSIRSNGIMLSPDGLTLYITNNTSVVAFDVRPDGSTTNRRDFGMLNGDTGGDGMAVDSLGHLYVTATKGIHVLAAEGKYLGLIPTPRRPISLAFSGPNKKTLYVPMLGAVGPNGKEWTTPEGVRNTAMTIYKIAMVAEGFKGRPK